MYLHWSRGRKGGMGCLRSRDTVAPGSGDRRRGLMRLLRKRTVVLHGWRALVNGLTLLLVRDHTATRGHWWGMLPMGSGTRNTGVEIQELDLVDQVTNSMLKVANGSLQ